MRKARTVVVEKTEIDFSVTEFSSVDSSVLNSLGKHCKETYWKILAGSGSKPVEVRINVDKQVAMSPEVSVTWNDEKLWPATAAARAKLTEDFRHIWPFRGTIKGIGVQNNFEVRPEHIFTEQWFPATITEQRPDGLFKATLLMPNSRGQTDEVALPAVKLENIREALGDKKPLVIPQRSLVLEVPKADPLHVTLSVDGRELITHFFARHTPPPPKALPSNAETLTGARARFTVNQARTNVVAPFGHHTLSHFLTGEVRAVRQEATPLKRSWTFMIGPFAEHTVVLEKPKSGGKVVRMLVDDSLLVESNAEDIESKEGFWECSFRFMGEKFVDWEVYETDANGNPLPSTGVVTHRSQYTHEVHVTLPETEKSLVPARLVIDDRDFSELPEHRVPLEETLSISPDAIRAAYNLTVPYKVSDAAIASGGLLSNIGNNISHISSPLLAQGGQISDGGFFSSLFMCCSKPMPNAADELQTSPRPHGAP